ncbi:hypothetical protein DFS34DRAFT_608878, partial [Phlyctochytrium arcticum]
MLVITSAVKVLSIVSNDHKKWDVILAVPTADGAFVELPASVWVKPNRIVEPEEDGGYFCVAAIMDAKSSDLQVYTFQPLPDWTEPCPAQVSLAGIISTVQEDSAKLGYSVYWDGVEAQSVTITRPGGWKTRRSVLVKGAVLEVVGFHFYLTGATARLPTITSAASTSRAQVWGRKPQSAADSPVRKHRSAGCDSATALDSSATFSSPSSSYSYPSGSPEPSRSPPAKLPALTANGKRRGRPPKAKPAEEAHLAPSKKNST